jgi:hypothetical protein
MPAQAWSCPTCGDLNVDAEAAHFDFLAVEPPAEGSHFMTPMEPGPFATPMLPWNYETLPSGITGAPEGEVHEVLGGTSGPLASLRHAVHDDAPGTDHANREERSTGLGRVEGPSHMPAAPVAPASTYGYGPAGPANAARREHEEVVRARPRAASYGEQKDYGDTRQMRPAGHRSTRFQWQTDRVHMQYAPLMELLAYIGLLGVGHIYAGHLQRGILLLTGWWAWFLVAKALSLLSHGATDPLGTVVGLVVPLISCLWLYLEKYEA